MPGPALLRPEPSQPPALAPSVRPLVVMKFGGSVLSGPGDVPAVASHIYREVRRGRRVIAVVSAFAGETDRLLQEARTLGLAHDNPLLPASVILGEERAATLVAMACDRVGLGATILSVRSLGLVAEGPAEQALPTVLDRGAIDRALIEHEVVIVPGFGALSADGRVVLLGRGGSDLTALFLAAELGLDHVELVKDVDALYDRAPGTDPEVRRYDRASWAEARSRGGALVQPEALDLAKARGLRIQVGSPANGRRTVIGPETAPPRQPESPPPLKIAVAGCGVVGGGALARLLGNPGFEVVGVLVRDASRPRDLPGVAAGRLAPLLVTEASELLAREPDILLEALSEADAGYALICAALARGVDVASANKQAVSRDPAGLLALARLSGVELAWSASVGGGVPMLETLRAAAAQEPVVAFEAVLNGTVNFMLDRMDAGATFEVALAEARAAGFAEEDPSSDLEGLDAAAKVRLLAFDAFGRMPEEADIRRDILKASDVPPAGARQVCRCRIENGRLLAEVRLSADRLDPMFATLKGEGNALKVISADGSVRRCRGRGAGRWPTAESLLADLGDLAAHRRARQAG